MSTRVPGFGGDPAADKGGRGRFAACRPKGAQGSRGATRAISTAPPRELNGRGGLDPVRYGDWEVKGLASDF